MERRSRRAGGSQSCSVTPLLPHIERLLDGGGSINVGEVDPVGCVAAAADHHLCYAMLARRDNESLLEILLRLDRAIANAAETGITVDEVNPPGGFPEGTL